MYWLLNEDEQKRVRNIVSSLTTDLSVIHGNPQADQLFPFVGRKDRRKAESIVHHLSPTKGVVADPFSGSGIHPYAISTLGRTVKANEWEPYTNRLSSSPWRLPKKAELEKAYKVLIDKIQPELDRLYWTKCTCGSDHVFKSLFYDRVPLKYNAVTEHERLGPNSENIEYRGKYKCPDCNSTVKFFDKHDAKHIAKLATIPTHPIFATTLIENSRINLSKEFTVYSSLFPQRSKLALVIIWNSISGLDCPSTVKLFLEDVFLSILPQAKYKDYRSKSQDLHCPDKTLRENNLLYVYQEQYRKRWKGLNIYKFAQIDKAIPDINPIQMFDFRDFFNSLGDGSVDLVFTDPPWIDGTAYFERAQLYHPWINYDLKKDKLRLEKEMVVSDAPTRKKVHNIERWWSDLEVFFQCSYRVLKTSQFVALFFRPIPANQWLTNLNSIKLTARKAGFEPLLSIDVGSSDPSMRIQQSASYVFSKDVVMLFLCLEPGIRREFSGDYDLDQYVYQTAVEVQEDKKRPFFYPEWRKALSAKLNALGISKIDSPKEEPRIFKLFGRYCDEITANQFLPKIQTPFSSQLFDTPAIERLFTYVPQIIDDLTQQGKIFTYDQFLLELSEFVENGTRQLITTIEKVDMKSMIETYAEALPDGLHFRRRPLPTLPKGLTHVLALDPYDFEAFVAQLLSAQGYTQLALLGRSGDRGVDVMGLDDKGRSTVVQCKRYIKNNVSSEPIQRLHSFAVTRGAKRKILVTTSDFTPQAKEEAHNTGTELVNGKKLELLISKFLPNMFR
jgi:16S rRNA G966 N2-methylase RsmD